MAQNFTMKEERKVLEQNRLQVKVISKTSKRKGLCLDCIRSENCTLSHNLEEIVWNCEDYENEDVSGEKFEQITPKKYELESKIIPAEESTPGLCAHCIYKETCSLKGIDGGVWHCEEYA